MEAGAYTLQIVRPDGTAIDLPHDFERVTTVLKAVFAKEGLIFWAYDIGAAGVQGLAMRGYDVAGMEWPMLRATLDEYGANPHSVRDQRADEGSATHDYLERLATGDKWPTEAGALPETGWEQAVASWWMDTKPIVVAAEKTLVSVTDRYAGTADLIYRMPVDSTMLKITDLKTKGGPRPLTPKRKDPQKLNPYDENHAQLGAYARAWREMTGVPIAWGSILFAFEDGVYAEVECQPDERLWMAALQMYRALRARKEGKHE